MADINKSKKREIIKNVAIVFLAVMLLLTFFSNTIMNISLAEVSTEYVIGNSIVTRVTGTGTVTAVDPYKVMTTQSRKVKSVAVRQEDVVEKGDVIYYLEDTESEELKTARKELENLSSEYESTVLDSGLTSGEVAEVESGNIGTLSQHMAQLEADDSQIAAAKKALEEANKKVDDIQKQIDLTDTATVDTSKEKKKVKETEKAYNEAKADLDIKENLYNQIKEEYDKATKNGTVTPELTAEYEEAKDAYNKAFENATKLKADYNNATAALERKKGEEGDDSQLKELNRQLVNAKYDAEVAQAKYDEIADSKDSSYAKIKAKMTVSEAYNKIKEKRKEIDSLEANDIGGEIVAPVSGTLTEVNFTAGETLSTEEAIAVIQIAGKGYTLSYPVTKQQAAKVKIGDEVTIGDGWWYSDVTANLVAVQPDRSNNSGGKILEFELMGDSIYPGQTLSVSVGQKSSYYDLVVPNNAMREDSNGKFILIMDSKNTPFGSRYVARRCDVEVLASDDNNTAISGDLYGYEYVITTASKPVSPGDQVRLSSAEN